MPSDVPPLPSPETYHKIAELIRTVSAGGEPEAVLRGLIEQLRDWSGCDAVGIRLRDGADYPYFETRGFSEEFVRLESRLCTYDREGNPVLDEHGNPKLECMCGNVIQGRTNPEFPFFTGRGSFWTNSTTVLLAGTTEAQRQSKTRNRCNGAGYESVALIPLRFGGETFGLLQFNDKRRRRFTPELIAFLECLADSVALALSRLAADKALKESERRYRAMFEQGTAVKLLIDPETATIVDANPAAEAFYGYPRGRLVGMPVWQLDTLPPAEVRSSLAHAVSGARNHFFFRHRLAGGEVREVEVYSSPLPQEGKTLLFSIVHDITARRRMETVREKHLADLAKKRAFLEGLIDNAPISIGVVEGARHRFILANPTYEAVPTDRSRSVVGRTVAEVFPDVAAEVVPLFDRIYETGETVRLREFKVPIGDKTTWWDADYVPLTDGEGRVRQVLILGHEITARKKAEADLRASLQEKEVLLKEIHHRVKNNLQIISSLLYLQSDMVKDREALDLFQESRNRIVSMALVHEGIYRSGDLSRVDVREYLGQLVPRLVTALKGERRIDCTLEVADVRLTIDQAVPFGLIVNEAVTNALKHAFRDRASGLVAVRVGQANGLIEAMVKDDGVGLPAGFSPAGTATLGMQLLTNLIRQLKGTLRLDNGGGTTFAVTFPAAG